MQTKHYIIGAVLLGVVVVFGYYAVSPLFRIVTLDEANPVAETGGILTSGEVVGTTGHPASGTVRIVEADGETYVRYEDFKTINGPDIFVYLSKDLEANEFVNLGRVRATEGNVNYKVPAAVDVSEYRYVLTWCRAFGVLFNYADIGG